MEEGESVQVLKSIRNILFIIFVINGLIVGLPVQSMERPIVVVIPSYNNAQWCRRNLESVFMQQYSNYRVIYIDDCSNDGTYELVKQYVKECNQENRVLLLRNKRQRGALANHYKAVHLSADHEIILNLDGDDWLKHEQVFSRINEVYSNPHVWMTYGSYENYPSGRAGECSRPIPAVVRDTNAYREHTYVTSHLRTFYAGLFKQIKLGDLLYNGKFLQAACDTAFMFPMLEMARERVAYLKEVFYVYNQSNPHNHFRKGVLRQLNMVHIMRARRKYNRLGQLPMSKTKVNIRQEAGIVILSENNPQQLQQLLESIDSLITNVGAVKVVYQTNNEQSVQYNQLKHAFSQVDWYAIAKANDFKSTLLEAINASGHDYITIVRDNLVINDNIDLNYCLQLMQQSHAYGFFFSLGKNVTGNKLLDRKQKQPPTVLLDQEVYAWKFHDGEFDWRMVHNINMTLYHKNRIKSCLQDMLFNSIDSLATAWGQCAVDGEDVGLFFKQSKVRLAEQKNDINQPKQQIIDLTEDEFSPCLEVMQLAY